MNVRRPLIVKKQESGYERGELNRWVAATDSPRPPEPTSRMGQAKWRMPRMWRLRDTPNARAWYFEAKPDRGIHRRGSSPLNNEQTESTSRNLSQPTGGGGEMRLRSIRQLWFAFTMRLAMSLRRTSTRAISKSGDFLSCLCASSAVLFASGNFFLAYSRNFWQNRFRCFRRSRQEQR